MEVLGAVVTANTPLPWHQAVAAPRRLMLILCVLSSGCQHSMSVSVNGAAVTDDGREIRGGTILFWQSGGPGAMFGERVLDIAVTDKDGKFRADLTGVRGALEVELMHEHCDWYASSTYVPLDEVKKTRTIQVPVKTKEEICADWQKPFAGQ